jgi:hypothetical protein
MWRAEHLYEAGVFQVLSHLQAVPFAGKIVPFAGNMST